MKIWSILLLAIIGSSAFADSPKSVSTSELAKDQDGSPAGLVIRKATDSDLAAIEKLAEQKGNQYEKYQPIFQRRAKGASKIHHDFMKSLIANGSTILLVSEDQGTVNGYVNASLVSAPPVYNPGGKICYVDDFMVSKPGLWQTVGKSLVEAAFQVAKKEGAVMANVVCSPWDEPKRQLLVKMGFSVASEWHVKPL